MAFVKSLMQRQLISFWFPYYSSVYLPSQLEREPHSFVPCRRLRRIARDALARPVPSSNMVAGSGIAPAWFRTTIEKFDEAESD